MAPDAPLLTALAVVLCVAGVVTVVCQRLRQPVVLGYVLAGLIVGPHVPVPLVADRAVVQTLSELGVVLLMFSLGLDFSLRRLVRIGPTALATATIECSAMFWLGLAAADLLGWSARAGLFTGAMIAISSTTIIAKAFEDLRVTGRLREVVVGVLVVEDLFAVLLLALLPALAAGDAVGLADLARSAGRLFALLAALTIAGLALVPRLIRVVLRLGSPETTLVATLGLCFAGALLAHEVGYSVALGAFLAGSLVAESGATQQIEPLVRPVRDLFAAIFFVSVGLLLDPALLVEHASAVLVLTGVVIAGKIGSVGLAAFVTGNGARTSLRAGMSLAQIGEFSFVIVGLGVALGAVPPFLFAVAVGVSVLTALSTPWLIRASPAVAAWVDRKLPARLQTFAALYGSWVERLGAEPRGVGPRARLQRLFGLLALDALTLGALSIAASAFARGFVGWLAERLGASAGVAAAIVLGAVAALAAPLVFGVARIARRIATALAERALPGPGAAGLDLSAAPRRLLVTTLQLAIVLLVSLPLLAATQPFLPRGLGPLVLGLGTALLAIGLWRSAAELQGHVRAGATAIIEALAKPSPRDRTADVEQALAPVRQLLPGLGEPHAHRLGAESHAAGRTLSELNLRGLTGATLLAITRGERSVTLPSAGERLQPGDVLALAGSHEAVAAAIALLERGAAAPGDGAPL